MEEEAMDLLGTLLNAAAVLAVGVVLTRITTGIRRDVADLRAETRAGDQSLREEIRAVEAGLRRELSEVRSDLTRVALAVGAEPRASGQ
jgi:hypothetical protein